MLVTVLNPCDHLEEVFADSFSSEKMPRYVAGHLNGNLELVRYFLLSFVSSLDSRAVALWLAI